MARGSSTNGGRALLDGFEADGGDAVELVRALGALIEIAAVDERRFRVEIEAQLQRGTYADPRLGDALFGPWATAVLAGRVNLRPASRDRDESYFRNHVLAAFGDGSVAAVRRADE